MPNLRAALGMARKRGKEIASKQEALDDAVGELKTLRDEHNVLLVVCKICKP